MAALRCPLAECVVTSPYGPRPSRGDFHTGIDLRARTGTLVYAAGGGVVRRVWWGLQGGLVVAVSHTDRLETRYVHLSSAQVRAGDRVTAGQPIAKAGASGTTTGAHLHFEVLTDGKLTDPAPWIGLPGGNVAPPPWEGISAYPRDAAQSCPSGYAAGTVKGGLLAGVPFNLWFGRQTNPDGTINACIQTGLEPGDNAAVADVQDAVAAAIASIPGAIVGAVVSIAVPVTVVVLAWSGVRRILG